jgi:hypothetical protein
MFLLYHSDGCNTIERVFHWCYVNDLHTTHAVVCWVAAAEAGGRGAEVSLAGPLPWGASASGRRLAHSALNLERRSASKRT